LEGAIKYPPVEEKNAQLEDDCLMEAGVVEDCCLESICFAIAGYESLSLIYSGEVAGLHVVSVGPT
jgi:hypothetical protein